MTPHSQAVPTRPAPPAPPSHVSHAPHSPHSPAVIKWSLAAALAMMVVWGSNFAVTKVFLAHTGVMVYLFVRFAWLPLLGFALLAWVYRGRWAAALPARADWPRFALCGVLGHTVHVSVVHWGMNLSTAFSSALVLTSGPIFTLLILAALGAEKLHRPQVAGTIAAFVGILIFLSDKFTAGLASAGGGDLVLLSAAFLFALYTVLSRPLTARYGPVMLLAWTLAFGAPPLLLAALPSALAFNFAAVPWSIWGLVAWASTVSAFLGWLVWAWVNQVRGVAKSAPLQYLMPPIAALVSWWLLGETFTAIKIGGALIVMAGVAYAQFAGRRVEEAEEQIDSA